MNRAWREREADEGRELVRRGADAIAPLLTLLPAIDPDRLAIDARAESRDELAQVNERYEAQRAALSAFALSHPSRNVLDLANRFDVAIFRTITAGGWLLRDVLSSGDFQHQLDVAKREHAEARRLAGDLHAAIVGSQRALEHG